MTDRAILTNVEDDDVPRELRRFGISIEGKKFSDIAKIIERVGASDDNIESRIDYPKFPPGTIGLIIPLTYWNINVKRASIVSASALIDALATSGLLTAALALAGVPMQSIGRLNTDSGEYCCLVHSKKLQADEAPISPAIVHQFISGKPCPFAKFNCNLMRGAACNATIPAVEKLFDSLEKKGALEKKDSGWSVPL